MDNQQSFNGVRPSMRIRILVVDDQYMSLNMASTTLRSLNYEVLTAKHPFEALSTLRLMQGGIDLVISDYHMPDMNGVQLQKRIHEEFKIPVIMMSVDSREYVMIESLRGGSKVFLVKPIHVEKVENVWQYVVANNKGKSPLVGIDRGVGNYLGFQDPRPVSLSISNNMQDQEEGGNNKNRKVNWTNALHTLFLQAIDQIGLDKAVPKKILDRMNVPGLTRQHVASHLQKYRIFLKKVAERGLVKSDDPQKALNDAFELTMASNAQSHDMILSMPPSQFARSQLKFGSSSSVLSIGTTSSSSHRLLNHGLAPCSTLGRATSWNAPNSNALENSSAWNGNPNNIQNCLRMHANVHQFPTRLGLNSMTPNSNNIRFGGLGNEPTRLGLGSMSTNPNHSTSNNNHIGITMGGNEHLIPSRLGLSSSYKPDHIGFDTRIDSTKVLENLIEPNTSGHGYGDNLQENCASNDIVVSSYVLDELERILPPRPDMSEKPTLGDDGFDSLDDLDLSKLLLLTQGNGDIDMAFEYAPHILDEQPITTNESDQDQWDGDFIGSLLVDDGPYMEAD